MLRRRLALELPPPAVGAVSLRESLDSRYLSEASGSVKKSQRKRPRREIDEADEIEIDDDDVDLDDESNDNDFPLPLSIPRSAVLSLGKAGITSHVLARAQSEIAAAVASAAMMTKESSFSSSSSSNGERERARERSLSVSAPTATAAVPRPSLALLPRASVDRATSAVVASAAAASAARGPPHPRRLSLAVSSLVSLVLSSPEGGNGSPQQQEGRTTAKRRAPARARADAWLADGASFEIALSRAAEESVSSPPSRPALELLFQALALEPDLLAREERRSRLEAVVGELVEASSGNPGLWRFAERLRMLEDTRRRQRQPKSLLSLPSPGDRSHLGRLREALRLLREGGKGGEDGGEDDEREGHAPAVAAAAAAADAAEEEAAASSSCRRVWLSLAPERTACYRCLEAMFVSVAAAAAASTREEGERKKNAAAAEAAASLAARFFCCPSTSASPLALKSHRKGVSEALLLSASLAPRQEGGGGKEGEEEEGKKSEVHSWASWLSGDDDVPSPPPSSRFPRPSPSVMLGPWVSRVMLPLAWLSSSASSSSSLATPSLSSLLRRVGRGGGAGRKGSLPPSCGPWFGAMAAEEALEWARRFAERGGKGLEARALVEELEGVLAQASSSLGV